MNVFCWLVFICNLVNRPTQICVAGCLKKCRLIFEARQVRLWSLCKWISGNEKSFSLNAYLLTEKWIFSFSGSFSKIKIWLGAVGQKLSRVRRIPKRINYIAFPYMSKWQPCFLWRRFLHLRLSDLFSLKSRRRLQAKYPSAKNL